MKKLVKYVNTKTWGIFGIVVLLLMLVNNNVTANDTAGLQNVEPTPTSEPTPVFDQPSIIGGEEVSPKYKYPWMVHLDIVYDQGTRGDCGGAIVNEEWILTAGHCVDDYDEESVIWINIFAGDHDITDDETEGHEQPGFATWDDIFLHADYVDLETKAINDIALIHLQDPLEMNDYVQKITLDSDNSDTDRFDGYEGISAGWGRTSLLDGSTSDVLKETSESIFLGNDCNSIVPIEMQDKTICSHPGGIWPSGPYSGDSGGPLFLEIGGEWLQIGILSWVQKNEIPVNDMSVRVAAYHDWILSNIPPFLKNETIDPSSGDISTQFNYSIDYKDTFSRVPSTIDLIIIEPDTTVSPITMAPGGSDWENGVSYTASAVFSTPGDYDYYYRATVDGTQYRYPEDSNLTFTVTGQPTYTISGYVKEGSSGLADVWVTDGFRGDYTDGTGYYKITGVPNGSYSVQPAKQGYSFSPESRPVTVSGGNATVSDFYGAPISIDGQTFYPVADTSISSLDTFTRYGSLPQLWVGYDEQSHFDRGLLKFDLSSLAGKLVYDVALDIYFNVDDGSSIGVSIRNMEDDWPESIRYSEFNHNYSSYVSQNEVSVSGSGWETWEGTTFTYWVKDWIENPSTNYGLLLYPEDNEGVLHGWLSKESANQDYWPRITLKVYNLDDPSDLYATAPEPNAGETAPFTVGQNVCWKVAVTNAGPGDSSYNDVGYYLGTTSSDYSNRIDEDKISPILAGQTVTDDDFCYEFQSGDVGTRYFNIWVDDFNGTGTPGENDETNETNNKTYYGPFEVIVPNETPVITGLPDHIYSEDSTSTSTVDLWAYTTDDSADADLTFALNNTPVVNAGITLTSNRYIQIDPSTNWNGATTVDILVTDPQGAQGTDTFTVTINPVNDVPWIDPTVPNQEQELDQDIVIDLSDYENDIEDNGPALGWTVSGLDHAIVTGQSSDDDVLTFTPTSGYIGSDTVTLTLTDSSGATDTQSLALAWSEVITNHAPNTPTTPTPLDGISDVPVDQNFSWAGGDQDGDSVTYHVYLKPDGGSYSVFCTITTSSTSVTCNPASNLAQGTHYEWYVRASDGSLTDSSAVWDFTTVATPTNHAPNTPDTPSPADNATNISTSANLSWTGGDPDGDAVTYDVYFEANDTSPDVLLCNDASTAFCDPGTLSNGTHYYWYVIARDAQGLTSTGIIWDFTTVSTPTNHAPNTPTVPTPSDGVGSIPVDTNFSWTGGDQDGDSVTYQVHLRVVGGSYSVFCTTSTSSTSVTCNPASNLAQGTHYEWYVSASDGSLLTDSEEWSFTTYGEAPPAPNLLSPVDQESTDATRPSFTWSVVPNAVKYTWELKRIADNSVVTKATYDASVRCDASTCTIPSPVTLVPDYYKWHVVAYTTTAIGEWSGYNRFLLVGLDTPRLRSPGVDAIVYGGRPTFKWYEVGGAALYDLALYGTDGLLENSWTKGLASCGVEYCEFRLPYDLASDYGAYQWQVRARSENDESLWSDKRTFTYTQLARTWLISPMDNYATMDTTPTLEWGDVTGATMYLVQFNLPDGTLVRNVLVSDVDHCDGSTCTWVVDPALALGSYDWHVRAKNGSNFGRWTAYRSIRITDTDEQPLLFEDFLGTSLPPTFRFTSNASDGGYLVKDGVITINSGVTHGGGAGIWSINSFSRSSGSELYLKMLVQHSMTNTGGWGLIEGWNGPPFAIFVFSDTNVLSGCVKETYTSAIVCLPFSDDTVNPNQMYVYEIIISENKTTFIFDESSIVEINAEPLSSLLYVYTDKMSPGVMTQMVIDSITLTEMLAGDANP